MSFVFETINLVSKTRDFVSTTGNFAFKMMNFADMSDDNTTTCMPYGEEKIFQILGNTEGFIPHRQYLPRRIWIYSEQKPEFAPDFGSTLSIHNPRSRYNIPSRDFGDGSHGGSDALGCAAAIGSIRFD